MLVKLDDNDSARVQFRVPVARQRPLYHWLINMSIILLSSPCLGQANSVYLHINMSLTSPERSWCCNPDLSGQPYQDVKQHQIDINCPSLSQGYALNWRTYQQPQHAACLQVFLRFWWTCVFSFISLTLDWSRPCASKVASAIHIWIEPLTGVEL